MLVFRSYDGNFGVIGLFAEPGGDGWSWWDDEETASPERLTTSGLSTTPSADACAIFQSGVVQASTCSSSDYYSYTCRTAASSECPTQGINVQYTNNKYELLGFSLFRHNCLRHRRHSARVRQWRHSCNGCDAVQKRLFAHVSGQQHVSHGGVGVR